MKKVGILTFFDGINHGAYLQCFGLYQAIKKLGYNVKIINYKNPLHFIKEYKIFLWTKRPAVLYNNIKKILKFKKEQKLFPVTKFTFRNIKVKEKFDTVVVGSDIVWNFKNPLFGFDPIYFGHHLNTDRLISYAPSFGSMTIKDDMPALAKEGIEKFKHISVRDENSRILVEQHTQRKAEVVLDPIFLYDFAKETIPCPDDSFILVYAFSISDKQIEEVKDFAQKKNLKIVAVAYSQPWADKNIIAISPFEWLGYFQKATYIVTSTFHGTLFSIKYNKAFCVFPNDPINNKIKFILSYTDLTSHIYRDGVSVGDILSYEINNKHINSRLSILVDESLNYLKQSLV